MPTEKITLLLVEDDPALRYLLSTILANSGYDVRCAQDGFTALVAIREEIPDILLSDLFMPGMSGFELLSVVRRRYPMIPVIAMSSAYAGAYVPHGVVADAFYEKATDLGALLGLVSSIQPGPDGSASLPRSLITTIWIARKTDGSEDNHIILACPECLRTFAQSYAETSLVIHETWCRYCSMFIPYAVVQTTNPASPERLLTAAVEPLQ